MCFSTPAADAYGAASAPCNAWRPPIARITAGRLLGFLVGAAAFCAGGLAHAAPPPPPEHQQFATLIDESLTSLSVRDAPGDAQFFAAGTWQSDDRGCWSCQVGPGTAAAALWAETRKPLHRWMAVTTFDTAIRANRNPNGSFGDPSDSPDISTMFFGLELGHAYLALKPVLGTTRSRRWAAALAGGADFLIANGNLAWYTNGNINLGNTMLYYLAWKVTGAPRFLTAYEESWRFTIAPPQGRWPGFGLRYLKEPARGDGRDGSAYLAESGGGRPGFDPEYTQVQSDLASRLYALSGDPRALRLTNLLVNTLLPRTSPEWQLATDGGTRRGGAGRTVPLTTPALGVLVRLGGRADLGDRLPGQLARVEKEYRSALRYSHRNYYRGMGGQVAVIFQSSRASSLVSAERLKRRTGKSGAPVRPPRPRA